MSDGGVFISRSFSLYWRADAVSTLGTYVTLFALQALVILTLDGTAADVGWLNASRWLPYLVFGLVVGALVDGRRRLPLITLRSINRAVVVVVAPIAGLVADAVGIRPMLVVAAVVFALVAGGLAASPFRMERAPA